MRKRIIMSTALLAGAILLAYIGTDASSAATSPGCTVDPAIDTEEQAFLQTINQYRQQNGRAPLKLSTTLNKAAAWKSLDMATFNYVAHDDTPSGRTWVDRIRDCGYTYNAWIGENIAVGNGAAAPTFEQWRGSSGHNANMLGSNYTAIGIGRAYNANSTHGWYWTTEFGSYSDGYSAPTPPPTATPPLATATPGQPPGSLPCPDVTDDGYVGTEDILFVLNRYMSSDSVADLDDSGQVNIQDILTVVNQYGVDC